MNFSSRTRGSTLLLVLAMLSILFLIGAALSYSTRLEGQASANYGELTQARMAAATGLPTALPLMFSASQAVTSTLQPWYTAPAVWSTAARATKANGTGKASVQQQAASLRAVGLPVGAATEGFRSAPQSMFGISDLSARVNLNAVRSDEALARYLKAVLPNGANPEQKAKAIWEIQGGDDVTTSPSRLDLRRTSSEPRIENLAALKLRSGRNAPALFSEAELRTLSNFVTVFSQSPELLNLSTTSSIAKLPLDNLTADAVLTHLRAAFPEKDEQLLTQFAANVADFADEDSVPTRLGGTDTLPNSPGLILGVEQTALITEVYPDSATRVTHGDEGQFVEISNPWDKALVLAGWRLTVAGGQATALNVVIPPGGRLIVTDNYDQPAEDADPESGSFLSIFGARKDDALRKVVVNGALELPDRDSFVTLEDGAGNLVDVFTYGNTGTMDSRMSFQRDDPRLRTSSLATATPFADMNGGQSASQAKAVAEAWKSGNRGSLSITDLFRVSTAFVGSGPAGQIPGGTSVAGGQAHPWQMPLLTVQGSGDTQGQAPGTANLDLRLLDLFTDAAATITPSETASESNTDSRISNRSVYYGAGSRSPAGGGFSAQGPGNRTTAKAADVQAPPTEDTESTGVRYAYGKINLNTSAKSALLALDVQLNDQSWPERNLIDKFETFRLRKLGAKEVPFLNVSDFIEEFLPELTADQLPAVESLLQQVTVNSSSFEIVAENRLSADEMSESARAGSKRRAAVARSRWTVALDQEPYSLLSFVSLP